MGGPPGPGRTFPNGAWPFAQGELQANMSIATKMRASLFISTPLRAIGSAISKIIIINKMFNYFLN